MVVYDNRCNLIQCQVDDMPQPTFLKVPCHWIVALSLDEKLHQVMHGGVWCTVLYSCAQWFRVVCGVGGVRWCLNVSSGVG